MQPIVHRVYSGANKPLRLFGVDYRLWVGASIFAMLEYAVLGVPFGLVAGVVSFLLVWLIARYLTRDDPEFVSLFFAIHRSSGKYLRSRLDARIAPKMRCRRE